MAISGIGSGSSTGIGDWLSGATASNSDQSFSSYLQNAAASSGDAPTGPSTSFSRLINLAKELGPSKINQADLKRECEAGLSEFRRTLLDLFDKSGVDTRQEIRLESNGFGGVVVAGGHPDADKIEDIFKENPDLLEKFHALETGYKKLQAGEGDDFETSGIFGPVFGLTILEDEVKAGIL